MTTRQDNNPMNHGQNGRPNSSKDEPQEMDEDERSCASMLGKRNWERESSLCRNGITGVAPQVVSSNLCRNGITGKRQRLESSNLCQNGIKGERPEVVASNLCRNGITDESNRHLCQLCITGGKSQDLNCKNVIKHLNNKYDPICQGIEIITEVFSPDMAETIIKAGDNFRFTRAVMLADSIKTFEFKFPRYDPIITDRSVYNLRNARREIQLLQEYNSFLAEVAYDGHSNPIVSQTEVTLYQYSPDR